MAENNLRTYYLFAMKAMADILGTILVPAVMAAFLRSIYDHLAYEQLIFFISLAVVFVLSMLMVVKKVQRYGAEYKKLTDAEPPSAGGGPRS